MITDCIFCGIVSGTIPCTKLFENDHILVFLDINPVNEGHTLVVPKRHFEDLTQTPVDILADIILHVKEFAPKIVKAVNADGFNTIVNTKPAAGQVVFHTHFHIIPRFENDGHKHWPGKTLSSGKMNEIQESITKLI